MISLSITSFFSTWTSPIDIVGIISPHWTITQLTAAARTYVYALYWTSHLLVALCPLLGGGSTVLVRSVSVASLRLSHFASMFVFTILHFLLEGLWSHWPGLKIFSSTPLGPQMHVSSPACYAASLLQCHWPASRYANSLPLHMYVDCLPLHYHRHRL
jgi:hypothetical protein